MTADRGAGRITAARPAGACPSHPPFRPHRPHGGAARKGARDE